MTLVAPAARAAWMCPKCRELGLETDCAEQLIHEAQLRAGKVIPEDGNYELEVTLTFAVPVTSTLPLDAHEMATHMRETWLDDDSEFRKVLADVVEGDYDLQVRPAFGL